MVARIPTRRAGGSQASPARDRFLGERGASLVEAAIVLPVVLLLAFGVVDFGLLFRHHHSLGSAARAGARAGAIAGNAVDADWQIVQAVMNSRATIESADVERIVVFKADDPDGRVPDACKLAAQPGCNVYLPASFTMDRTTFLAAGLSGSWPPAGRAASALAGTDHVGVWVKTNFDYVTGIFGSGRSVTDTVVMQIDPNTGELAPSASTLPAPPTTSAIGGGGSGGSGGGSGGGGGGGGAPKPTTSTTKKPKGSGAKGGEDKGKEGTTTTTAPAGPTTTTTTTVFIGGTG